MEELKIKKDILLQALATFEESLEIMNNPKYEEIYETTRDSAIQRFEYTIDSFWKFLNKPILFFHSLPSNRRSNKHFKNKPPKIYLPNAHDTFALILRILVDVKYQQSHGMNLPI